MMNPGRRPSVCGVVVYIEHRDTEVDKTHIKKQKRQNKHNKKMDRKHMVVIALMLTCMSGRATAETSLFAALGGKYEVGSAVRSVAGVRRAFTTVADSMDVDDNGHVMHAEAVSFEVEVFGEQLVLDLEKNTALFAPNYVERVYNTEGKVVAETRGRENCYYIGTVRGHPGSVVAMSTCEGLSGFMRLGRGAEDIHTEPAHLHLAEHSASNPRRRDVSDVAQIFYRTSAARGSIESECGLGDSAMAPGPLSVGDAIHAPASVQARRTGTNYLEWALVNDYSQSQWCAGAAECISPEARAADLANNVAGRYRDTDGGFTPAAEIVLIEQRTWAGGDEIAVTTDVAATLAAFSTWRNAGANDFDKDFNDAAHLITHVDFTGATVGLAYSSTVCKSTAVAVSQDRGIVEDTGNTMAHELGHNFGMTHDGQVACTIMAACACGQTCEEAGNTTNHWSTTSRDAYAAYTATVTCLANDPNAVACTNLPPLGTGQTAGTCVAGAESGTSCTLGCEAGTVASGDLGTTCDGGTWSVVAGTCEPTCESAPELPLATDGSCVANTMTGTGCMMICIQPFLPYVAGSFGSSSSADLPGLEFMCAAPDWLGPAGDAVCYYETEIDTDGATEIGPSGIVIGLDPADVSGSSTLTISGGTTCPPKPDHVFTSEIMEIGLAGGVLAGGAEITVTVPFLAGITQKGRDRSRLRYCDPTADGGVGRWRRYPGDTVDDVNNLITGNIPYPTSVAATAKDVDGIFEVNVAAVFGMLALVGVTGYAARRKYAKQTVTSSNKTESTVVTNSGAVMEALTLPPNWDAYINDAGACYYHNRVTKETTWDRPK